MSLLSTMFTGVSGLSAESDALGVIGNNVSNTNTIGFKESRAIFENVMGEVAPGAVGAGVRMATSQQVFTEGSLQNTGNPTDLALSGDGFFVVSGSVGGVTGNFYTRAGQTSVNTNGQLVNPDGLAFQGYQVLPSGQLSSQVGPITLSTQPIPPKATAKMSISANLDANATPPAAPWDPQNPATTSNFSTSLTTYDSLGNAHQVSVYFVNNGGNSWTYHELANGSEVQGGTPGQNVEIGSGTLTFDSNGNPVSPTPGSATVTFNNASAQTISLDVSGITQNGSPSAVTTQSADGYAAGSLSNVQIGSDGTVSGVYTNGQTMAVGQLAIAKFTANDGLASAGQNVWAATLQSGQAAVGTAGSGGRASITSGALEQSNVDIASQFVDLIAHQQGFQANSKTIQTADQMLSDVMQLIR